MRIKEIINESQQSLWGDESWPIEIGPRQKSYDKLNSFRKLKRGPELSPTDKFDDSDRVDTTQIKRTSSRQTGSAAVADISNILPKSNKPKEIDRVTRVREVINGFQQSAEENNRDVESRKVYKDLSFGISTLTNNGIRVSLGGRTGTDPNKLRISIDLVTKESKQPLLDLLEEWGYVRDPGTETKFKLIPSSEEDLTKTLNDVWRIVDGIEDLGQDFKSKSGGRTGNGAGSMIAGKQAPLQYYLWLAKNIYESVKNKTSWGFSRGGGDGSKGAYDQYNDLITIGITKGGIEQSKSGREPYREHVVPCDLINRMAIEICQKSPKTDEYRNKVIMDVARMIHRNLAVVLCSSNPDLGSDRDKSKDGEREKMDYEYGLMTTMPPGWRNGDNILERFTHCKIPVYKYNKTGSDNGKRLSENSLK